MLKVIAFAKNSGARTGSMELSEKSLRTGLACREGLFPALKYGFLLCSGQAWPVEEYLFPALKYGSLLCSGQAWPVEECLFPTLKYDSLLCSGQAWPVEE